MNVTEHPMGSPFGQEEIDVVTRLLREGGSLSFGPMRQRFEDAFAAANGLEFAVSCNSGTVALWLAMRVVGLGPGDRVIATPQTYQTTIFPALELGACVEFADIDGATMNMDPRALERRLDKNVKAVIVTHYGGNPADMGRIRELCRQAGAVLVADAAHAAGALCEGRPIAAAADITCFSFQSLKNMNTLGEGGMLTFHSRRQRNMARELSNNGVHGAFGQRETKAVGPYAMAVPPLLDHSLGSFEKDCLDTPMLGMNFRMSELQCAVGLVQLEKLERMNQRRRHVAALYDKHLGQLDGVRLWARDVAACSHHLYPVFIDNDSQQRHDRIVNRLHHEMGVEIIQRYFPLHLLHLMRRNGTGPGLCPVCEKTWFLEQINLPIHPLMTEEQVVYVAESLQRALARD